MESGEKEGKKDECNWFVASVYLKFGLKKHIRFRWRLWLCI